MTLAFHLITNIDDEVRQEVLSHVNGPVRALREKAGQTLNGVEVLAHGEDNLLVPSSRIKRDLMDALNDSGWIRCEVWANLRKNLLRAIVQSRD